MDSRVETIETFKCMMCGLEFEQKVLKGEDKEYSCPSCKSNSIRILKKRGSAKGEDEG